MVSSIRSIQYIKKGGLYAYFKCGKLNIFQRVDEENCVVTDEARKHLNLSPYSSKHIIRRISNFRNRMVVVVNGSSVFTIIPERFADIETIADDFDCAIGAISSDASYAVIGEEIIVGNFLGVSMFSVATTEGSYGSLLPVLWADICKGWDIDAVRIYTNDGVSNYIKSLENSYSGDSINSQVFVSIEDNCMNFVFDRNASYFDEDGVVKSEMLYPILSLNTWKANEYGYDIRKAKNFLLDMGEDFSISFK